MATLAAGGTSTATLSLDAFASVAVVCDASCNGTLTFTSAAPNLLSNKTFRLQNKTYGPFGVPGTLSFTVTAGSLTYTPAGNVGGFSYDTSGNITGLAGPNSSTLKLFNFLPNVSACLGDSLMGQNWSVTGDLTTAIAANTYNGQSRGCLTWMNFLSGGSFNFIWNGGISGERTDQILTRAPTVCALGLSWLFENGGTNDVSQLAAFFSSNATTCENAIVANRQAIWAIAKSYNIRVVASSIPPCASSQAWSATQIGILNRANRRLRDAALAAGVIWCDYAAVVTDTTNTSGYALSGSFYDGLHPNTLGAWNWGKALWTCVQYFASRYTGLISNQLDSIQSDTSSKQLLTGVEALFQGSTGAAGGTGMSGTQVSSYTIGRTAGTGTGVASVITSPDTIGKAQRVVWTSAAAEDEFRILKAETPLIATLPAGSAFRFECGVTVTSNTGLRSFGQFAQVNFTGGAASSPLTSLGMNWTAGDPAIPDTAFSGVLTSPWVRLPSDATAITSIRGQVTPVFASSGGATIDVYRYGLVKIN